MVLPRNRAFTLFVAILGLIAVLSTFAPVAMAAGDKSIQVDQHKELARVVTHSFAVGLGGALANVRNEVDRIGLIRSFIGPVRFFPDNSGYFYVYDSKGVNIAHAVQKDLQGTNLWDYKDAKGKLVLQALLQASQKGGGFVDFYWARPGTKEQVAKLGYVEPIPGTDYFIGTGVYLP
jgi:signal transduction histidine kinase